MVMTLFPAQLPVLADEYDEYGFASDGTYEPAEQNGDGYYEIGNVGQLLWFGALVNGDTSQTNITEADSDANAVLTADLDFSNYGDKYVPIGWTSFSSSTTSYTDVGYGGIFDGQGYEIKNLTINTSNVSSMGTVGIFGTVTGTVKNLGVDNFYFSRGSTDGRFGAIAGLLVQSTYNEETHTGTIQNCYVVNSDVLSSGTITGVMVGANYAGEIVNSYAYNSTNTGASRIGYLVGDNRNDGSNLTGTVTNCYADGTLVGTYSGTVTDGEESVSDDSFTSGEMARTLQSTNTDDEIYWGTIF